MPLKNSQQNSSDNSKKGFTITTAIAYPNNRMHVGFGWEVMGSDMVARFHRMKGEEVFFSTGLDEHSQNVEKAAYRDLETSPQDYEGLDPKNTRKISKKYCDKMASDIVKVMADMDVAYDRFIRTSDEDHERVCQALIQKAHDEGDVDKKSFEGLYCESCEVFYTEKEALIVEGQAPQCANHKIPLKITKEENYFFKLSKFEEALKKLFKEQPDFLTPEIRKNEVTAFIEGGLKDFSVSRTSFKWGIDIPFDERHIIYVWFDALVNYLSAVKFPIRDASGKIIQGDEEFFKKFWPADVHVIGKDITRFHCVYWPAMLKSVGIELPKKVFAHGFININGEKMSKTRGNIVTPDAIVRDYGTTALRWYMLSANPFDGDGNYGDELLVLKCNADLSNNIGNLVNRTVNMALKYFPDGNFKNEGKLPSGVVSVETRFKEVFGEKGERLSRAIDEMNLSGYCQLVIDFSMAMNKFIDETKPWSLGKELSKNPGNTDVSAQLTTVMSELLEGIRNLAVALWPVIPEASLKILGQLGISDKDANFFTSKLYTDKEVVVPRWEDFGFDSKCVFKLNQPLPIFPRLELNKIESDKVSGMEAK